MTRKIKILTTTALLIAIAAISTYHYIMVGGARNIAAEDTEYQVTTTQISNEYILNVDIANKKYLEKAITITGTIISINNLEVILDHNIVCILNENYENLKIGQTTTIKGRVVGYDDLLTEIKIDQCSCP